MKQSEHRGKLAYQSGAAAEVQVSRRYEEQGFEILFTRWRGARGEIDLILRKADMIVFVEVKKSTSFAQAAERITPQQMARIRGAAEEFLALKYDGQMFDIRFDAALMDAQANVEIVENAF